jgi:hypothetical protein
MIVIENVKRERERVKEERKRRRADWEKVQDRFLFITVGVVASNFFFHNVEISTPPSAHLFFFSTKDRPTKRSLT